MDRRRAWHVPPARQHRKQRVRDLAVGFPGHERQRVERARRDRSAARQGQRVPQFGAGPNHSRHDFSVVVAGRTGFDADRRGARRCLGTDRAAHREHRDRPRTWARCRRVRPRAGLGGARTWADGRRGNAGQGLRVAGASGRVAGFGSGTVGRPDGGGSSAPDRRSACRDPRSGFGCGPKQSFGRARSGDFGPFRRFGPNFAAALVSDSSGGCRDGAAGGPVRHGFGSSDPGPSAASAADRDVAASADVGAGQEPGSASR